MKTIRLILTILLFISCQQTDKRTYKIVKEHFVKTIDINAITGNPVLEISSATIYDNNLILTPQYPGKFSDNNGIFYKIPMDKIIEKIERDSLITIEPQKIHLKYGKLKTIINKRGNGFEAICFNNNSVYASIEVTNMSNTYGLLIKGVFEGDTIKFDDEHYLKIPSNLNLENYGYEAITIFKDKLFLFNELNGKLMVNNPYCILADTNLTSLKKADFFNVEYRITDATNVSEDSTFYLMNYFYPGDNDYKVSTDGISSNYGIGKSNLEYETKERILKVKLGTNNSVEMIGTPLYLNLENDLSRNWEGIAKYKNYIFLVTDMYPDTIIGYIKIKP